MRIFHTMDHELHAPAWYVADGAARRCPEVPGRVEAILAALRGAGGHEFVPVSETPLIENRKSKIENSFGRALRRVHSGGYLDYLRTIHGVWHGEFGTDVIPDTFPRSVVAGARVPGKASARAGHFCFDLAAPIMGGTWRAVVGSARAAAVAGEALLGGESEVYALCRPPGHHAGADYCGGFCYINNVAVAAQRLLDGGMKRVAILDLDYHHGNGTQDIFYDRRDVLFVSIHADPNTQYPYFWGFAGETGVGRGKGFTVNLPLRRGASAKQWFAALGAALGRVEKFRAEAVLVSMGADIHERDPVGDFRLGMGHFGEIGGRLAGLGIPTGFVQEGGYDLETIGGCVAGMLGGFDARAR